MEAGPSCWREKRDFEHFFGQICLVKVYSPFKAIFELFKL